LPERIEAIIRLHTAGSPTDPLVKWTHLKPKTIAFLYEQEWSTSISKGAIRRILKELGYRKRRPNKQLA